MMRELEPKSAGLTPTIIGRVDHGNCFVRFVLRFAGEIVLDGTKSCLEGSTSAIKLSKCDNSQGFQTWTFLTTENNVSKCRKLLFLYFNPKTRIFPLLQDVCLMTLIVLVSVPRSLLSNDTLLFPRYEYPVFQKSWEHFEMEDLETIKDIKTYKKLIVIRFRRTQLSSYFHSYLRRCGIANELKLKTRLPVEQ